MNVPKLIFIVPYRDRIEHKTFLSKYMEYIMEDYDEQDYEIYYAHQKDKRPFNRGGMKNIGFLALRKKYPLHYKNITFVFHDVDVVPYKKNLLDYETTHGIVKHYYGFEFALGGIFSIKGSDFEKTGGFPNFWAWGCEDNIMNNRVKKAGLKIDRSNFFPSWSRAILQFTDGLHKTICRTEAYKLLRNIDDDGLYTIQGIKHTFNNEYIDITGFTTPFKHDDNVFETHDIRNTSKIKATAKRGGGGFMNMKIFK